MPSIVVCLCARPFTAQALCWMCAVELATSPQLLTELVEQHAQASAYGAACRHGRAGTVVFSSGALMLYL